MVLLLLLLLLYVITLIFSIDVLISFNENVRRSENIEDIDTYEEDLEQQQIISAIDSDYMLLDISKSTLPIDTGGKI